MITSQLTLQSSMKRRKVEELSRKTPALQIVSWLVVGDTHVSLSRKLLCLLFTIQDIYFNAYFSFSYEYLLARSGIQGLQMIRSLQNRSIQANGSQGE